MSTCIPGGLLFCFGWLSALPLLCMRTGQQLLHGRCVSSCSSLSCPVGCGGAGRPCALLASCCSSMSSVMNSSLKAVFSSKFVEPVHSMSSVALLFVVQSSASVFPLVPFVGRTVDVLCCVNLVTSGPSSVCCGMYQSLLDWTCTRFHMCPSRIQ